MTAARVVDLPEGDEALNAHRYLEYWGGLGDVLNHVHWLPCYQALDSLRPGERAFVTVSSHNPHAAELFLWHPKAGQITVCNLGFHCSFQDVTTRDPLRLPRTGCSSHGLPFGPVVFYPAPEDLPCLESLRSAGKYVVFAPSSAERDKFVPQKIVDDAARRTLRRGYAVVLLGRNYIHKHYGLQAEETWRKEIRLQANGGGVHDLVDRLSVPGVMRAVEGAAGVFTAHSAVCMEAYHEKKPVFVLHNEHAKTYLPKPGEPWRGYFFGAGNPGCDRAWFPEYSSERMEQWLEGLA